MIITEGKVLARVDSRIYDADPDIERRLRDTLNDKFLGVQLLTHRAYELSLPSVTRVHPDGRHNICIEAVPARVECFVLPMDIKVGDKGGNSRQERIEKKKIFAELASAHRATDLLLGALLQSYDASVHDPENELVHLYEIRDALSTKFGGSKAGAQPLALAPRTGHDY
jgi:hypothetical protein